MKSKYHLSVVQLSLGIETNSVIRFIWFKNPFVKKNLNFYIKSLYIDLVEMKIRLLSTMFTLLSIFFIV